MPRKKKEEEIEAAQAEAVETETSETTETDESAEVKTEAATEEKPKKTSKKKADAEEESGPVETGVETVAEFSDEVQDSADAAAKKADGKADKGKKSESVNVSTVADSLTAEKGVKRNKRAEKVGIVQSDKMTKTVTVRVDRLVKHPVYRKYVKRRKKFMAHDETGATIGDKVRIIETRPLSARKRWRVVEIIQKAEK